MVLLMAALGFEIIRTDLIRDLADQRGQVFSTSDFDPIQSLQSTRTQFEGWNLMGKSPFVPD